MITQILIGLLGLVLGFLLGVRAGWYQWREERWNAINTGLFTFDDQAYDVRRKR